MPHDLRNRIPFDPVHFENLEESAWVKSQFIMGAETYHGCVPLLFLCVTGIYRLGVAVTNLAKSIDKASKTNA